jgi:hypothetical protein
MACKVSGVQIPSAPPQVRGHLRLASRPIRRRRAADLQQDAERDPVRAASATFSRLLLPLGRNAKRDRAASSIARVTRASIAGVSPIDPPNGLRGEARSRWPPEWPISGCAGSVPASSDSPWRPTHRAPSRCRPPPCCLPPPLAPAIAPPGAAYTQLHLARQLATDARLPWERPRPPGKLSPYRVRRGFPRLLCVLGSPASAPKPSGRSPGRPKGSRLGPAARYPAIKKPARKPRNKQTKIAKVA